MPSSDQVELLKFYRQNQGTAFSSRQIKRHFPSMYNIGRKNNKLKKSGFIGCIIAKKPGDVHPIPYYYYKGK
jgi:hypothetical protein